MRVITYIYPEVFMSFAQHFLHLRKDNGLTQQQMADKTGLHLTQVRRYETGDAQPSLDALKKIALAFNVSIDELVFSKQERDIADELRFQFEAVSKMSEEDKQVIKAVLDGMIVKHQTKQLVSGLSS